MDSKDFSKDKQNLALLKKALGKNAPYTNVTLSGKTASASNGILGITIPLDSGITAVMAGNKFIDIVLGCSNIPSLKLTDANLIVREGAFRALIPVASPEMNITDADETPDDYLSAQFSAITSGALLNGFSLVKHAISKDTARGILCSAALVDGTMYAVDGHRMAWKEIPDIREELPSDLTFPGILIDALANVELIDTLSWNDNNITIITGDNISIKCARHAGKFPGVKNIIPVTDQDSLIPVTREMRMAIAKIKKHAANDVVVFDGETIHDSDDQIYISGFSGFPKVALNSGYLTDAISGSDDVVMLLKEGNAPAYFEDRSSGIKNIVMPMRI